MATRDSTYRPLSSWEREQWEEIVHACTSRPGRVEFGPQAKAVILAVARELEYALEQLAGERLGRRTAEGARDAALLQWQELKAEIAESMDLSKSALTRTRFDGEGATP